MSSRALTCVSAASHVMHKCLPNYFEAVLEGQAAFAVTTNRLEVENNRDERSAVAIWQVIPRPSARPALRERQGIKVSIILPLRRS